MLCAVLVWIAGYIYAQDISEAIVGLSMALAGLTGIIGTVTFTVLRRHIGLERTGLIAYNAEILCLSLTVASIWVPGSPFDPFFKNQPANCTELNSTFSSAVTPELNASDMSHRYNPAEDKQKEEQMGCDEYQYNFQGTNISIILFLLGIITSRVGMLCQLMKVQGCHCNCGDCSDRGGWTRLFLNCLCSTGLWMADLVVTQLLQETVEERERGMVNSMQNSFNMLMDMIKFILVIFVPHIQTFGILIMLSFLFICMAGCFFAFYSWRVRGHLFHFQKVKSLLCVTRHVPLMVEAGGSGQGSKPEGEGEGAEKGKSERASEGSAGKEKGKGPSGEDNGLKGGKGSKKGDRDGWGPRKEGQVSEGNTRQGTDSGSRQALTSTDSIQV